MRSPKFAIGEIVALAVDDALFRAGQKIETSRFSIRGQTREPTPLQIITRLTEECSGGTQIMYRVTGEKGPILRQELELVPYDDALREAVHLSELRAKYPGPSE